VDELRGAIAAGIPLAYILVFLSALVR